MNQKRKQPGELLDDLMALFHPAHPDYLAWDLTDREREFLIELNAQRQADSRGLLFLTDDQAGYLRGIHKRVQNQIATAHHLAEMDDPQCSSAATS